MKNIAIIGAGESGTGAARLAQAKGMGVWVSDIGQIADKYKDVLCHHDIGFEEGTHSTEKILACDEIIISPGIPLNAALIVAAKQKGIPVISEIEFAWRYCEGKVIAITGSNGKTTTTSLIYHILSKAGLSVGLGGNIGKSFAALVLDDPHDYYVIEMSSFQLDSIKDFRPDIAVLLNITPDHLDRYDNKMENYVASKFRITMNQQASDFLVYCADDPEIENYMKQHPSGAARMPFSLQKTFTRGAFVNENSIEIKTQHKELNMTIHQLALQGKHNLYNSMAAAIAAKLLDIRNDVIRDSLTDFQNIEHRLERVGSVHGIHFINDSKATNVNSVWYALESVEAPVIWIAGGVDKGNDYSMLDELVKQKVKVLICLGKDNKKLMHAFDGKVQTILEAGSAEDAVIQAYRAGKKGDTVLLSPACASFDLFENYEDRGRKFKQAVKSL
ncbi:MAG: UDP-N-acetylmuramoyl-L-alanine--D-glutamate ligase [Flavobacteriales bacterium]|nr:UDP-N-acetylmuramoyl-L-alanine--D-glutamate ligase [Flavobacteriales bacterium]